MDGIVLQLRCGFRWQMLLACHMSPPLLQASGKSGFGMVLPRVSMVEDEPLTPKTTPSVYQSCFIEDEE